MPTSRSALFDFRPGAVSCDGGSPTAIAIARPVPAAGSIGQGQTVAPFRFTFRIDSEGRVLGIRPEPRAAPGIYLSTPDLQPALAASRFAAGAAQARCTIQYDVDVFAVADAPIALVRRYLTLPHDTSYLDREVSRRARQDGGDCYEGRPFAPLVRAYPDLDTIPQAPGMLSMTVTGFDLDAKGRPVRIRTLQSDGNTALDDATRRAVAASRFKTDRPRTGCVQPMYRRQSDPLPAPEALPIDQYRGADGGCPPEDTKWAHLPPLTFPEPFRRRGIEGWAVVRYDIAPWGQTGNVTVVASEPAAAFGEQARQIIGNARRQRSSRGASGCVERVRFKLPEGDAPAPNVPPPPPPIVD